MAATPVAPPGASLTANAGRCEYLVMINDRGSMDATAEVPPTLTTASAVLDSVAGCENRVVRIPLTAHEARIVAALAGFDLVGGDLWRTQVKRRAPLPAAHFYVAGAFATRCLGDVPGSVPVTPADAPHLDPAVPLIADATPTGRWAQQIEHTSASLGPDAVVFFDPTAPLWRAGPGPVEPLLLTDGRTRQQRSVPLLELPPSFTVREVREGVLATADRQGLPVLVAARDHLSSYLDIAILAAAAASLAIPVVVPSARPQVHGWAGAMHLGARVPPNPACWYESASQLRAFGLIRWTYESVWGCLTRESAVRRGVRVIAEPHDRSEVDRLVAFLDSQTVPPSETVLIEPEDRPPAVGTGSLPSNVRLVRWDTWRRSMLSRDPAAPTTLWDPSVTYRPEHLAVMAMTPSDGGPVRLGVSAFRVPHADVAVGGPFDLAGEYTVAARGAHLRKALEACPSGGVTDLFAWVAQRATYLPGMTADIELQPTDVTRTLEAVGGDRPQWTVGVDNEVRP